MTKLVEKNAPSSVIEAPWCQMGNLSTQEVANQIVRVKDNVFFSSDGEPRPTKAQHQVFCPLLSSWYEVTADFLF